jgi:hypothetical protein
MDIHRESRVWVLREAILRSMSREELLEYCLTLADEYDESRATQKGSGKGLRRRSDRDYPTLRRG